MHVIEICGGMVMLCSKLKPVKLAWVSVQIHCQCSVSENRVILPADSTPGQRPRTTRSQQRHFFRSVQRSELLLCIQFNIWLYQVIGNFWDFPTWESKLFEISDSLMSKPFTSSLHPYSDYHAVGIRWRYICDIWICFDAGEKGSTVLATKPTILVCDLTLLPGETQTCQHTIYCISSLTSRSFSIVFIFSSFGWLAGLT